MKCDTKQQNKMRARTDTADWDGVQQLQPFML